MPGELLAKCQMSGTSKRKRQSYPPLLVRNLNPFSLSSMFIWLNKAHLLKQWSGVLNRGIRRTNKVCWLFRARHIFRSWRADRHCALRTRPAGSLASPQLSPPPRRQHCQLLWNNNRVGRLKRRAHQSTVGQNVSPSPPASRAHEAGRSVMSCLRVWRA